MTHSEAILSKYVNPHVVGVVLKEVVRRAIGEIRRQRFIFEAQPKLGSKGEYDDLVTSADHAAQAIYQKTLIECFPEFGIVAEENNLKLRYKTAEEICFTIDPLDGTKAYGRRQSHGIGTMVSLVCDEEVVSAYVGDIMTQEVYGYRPCSDKVHRISEFEKAEPLVIDQNRQLREQYVLLRDPVHKHGRLTQNLVMPASHENFRGVEITGGSIGTCMARLWKGEVGAVILRPSVNKPWDWCPVTGITLKLGFDFYRITARDVQRFIPRVSLGAYEVDSDVLILHSSRREELGKILEETALPARQ